MESSEERIRAQIAAAEAQRAEEQKEMARYKTLAEMHVEAQKAIRQEPAPDEVTKLLARFAKWANRNRVPASKLGPKRSNAKLTVEVGWSLGKFHIDDGARASGFSRGESWSSSGNDYELFLLTNGTLTLRAWRNAAIIGRGKLLKLPYQPGLLSIHDAEKFVANQVASSGKPWS